MKKILLVLLLYTCSLQAQTERNFQDPFKVFYTTEYRSLLSLQGYCISHDIKTTPIVREEYTEVHYNGMILYYNYYSRLLEFLTFETNTSVLDVVTFYKQRGYRIQSINKYGLYYLVSNNHFSISVEKGSKKPTSVSLQNDNLE